MQYLRGWRALREDPGWMMKLLVAALLSFIPVVGNIVTIGWMSLMLRRAVSGQDAPTPRLELDLDYGMKLLHIGFKGFLVRLLWSLPFTVFAMLIGFCVSFGSVFATANGGEDGAVTMLIILAVFMVVFPFMIMIMAMPLHIATLRVELTDDVKAGMDVKATLKMTRVMLKELFVGSIVLQLLGFVGVMVGLLSCYLLLIPAILVLRVIHIYWLAEIYQRYLEKGGEPLEVGPLDVEPPAPQPSMY